MSPEELELAAAQQRLTEAKERVAHAERLRLEKAAADLAAYRAAEDKKLREQQGERERIEAQHAKRQQEQAETEQRERQAKLAKERALEMALNQAEEEARRRAEKEAELRKVEDAAVLAEQEAKRLEAELARASAQPTHEEQPENIRTTLFNRLSGLPAENPVVREVPSGAEPRGTAVPEAYAVRNGRINPRVFESRFELSHRGNFFVSPSTGELVLNGYRWRIEDSLSPRIWQHGCGVYIALVPGGYELRRVGTSDRVRVTPVGIVEGLTFEPLPEESAAVDQDELLMCEATQ